MKKIVFVAVCCLCFLRGALCLHAMQAGEAGQVFEISREYWEGCETGLGECKPLAFVRASQSAQVTLRMPCGGTRTSVTLTRVGEASPLRSLQIGAADCPPQFDLTGLPDGDYEAYMLACALGGPVRFSLQTAR
jgi:hypothetical protein